MRRVITLLTAQVGALTAQAPDDDAAPRGAPKGVPGLKPTEPPVRDRAPRRKRAQGFARLRMQATAWVEHALESCPDCGAPLAPVVVTEHVYLARRWPDCGRRCAPPPELDGIVTGRSRLGNRLVSLLAVLREEARLPVATIQRLLGALAGLHLSVGAIVGAVQRLAERAAPVVTDLGDAIRASPVVHADETGWREDGHNGSIWTFSTPEHWLFLRGSRAKAMLTQGLGDAFGGVLVSDFYTVYTGDDGVHQYCWVHLLRDIHDLTVQHPDDGAIRGWAGAVRAQAGATGSRVDRWRVRKQAQADLRTVCQPWREPRVPQTTRCHRILRYLECLFVTEPLVPATDNAAERSLRPLVVSRKISGGTRSARGTATKMTLASLFGTWRVRGINPFEACQELLATP